jgi:hypothetical protein
MAVLALLLTVTADDLDTAVSAMVAALRPGVDRDWPSVPAAAVETDCWHAGEHIGDVLVSYAGQRDDAAPYALKRIVPTRNAHRRLIAEPAAVRAILAMLHDPKPATSRKRA